MRKPLSPYLFIAVLSFALQSCLSTANFETGRTIGKGNYKTDIAINHIGYNYVDYNNSSLDIEIPEDYFCMNLGLVYGVINKLDFGGNFSTTGEMSFKTKFMLTKPNSLFSTSVGSSLYFYPSILRLNYLHTNIAIYTSLHPSKRVTIYAYPQLLFLPKNSELSVGRSITVGIMYNHLFRTSLEKNFSMAIEYCGVTYNKLTNQNTFSIGLILYQ